jgi:hypothetical protein
MVMPFCAAGEDLLTIYDVVVAISNRARLQAGKIGAGPGLRIADCKDQFAGRDARQNVGLLLLRAEPHQRRTNGVYGDEGERRLGKHQFFQQDFLSQRVQTPAAITFRPAGRQPAILAHLPDDLAVGVPAFDGHRRCTDFRRHDLVEVSAELRADRLLLGREINVHALLPSWGKCRAGPACRW